jgi:hypothetical protein
MRQICRSGDPPLPPLSFVCRQHETLKYLFRIQIIFWRESAARNTYVHSIEYGFRKPLRNLLKTLDVGLMISHQHTYSNHSNPPPPPAETLPFFWKELFHVGLLTRWEIRRYSTVQCTLRISWSEGFLPQGNLINITRTGKI